MDYSHFIRYHHSKNADLTIAAIETDIREASRFGIIQAEADGRVVGFQEKPNNPQPVPGHPDKAFVSMGIYIFKRDTLIDVLTRDAGSNSSHDFGKDIIPLLYSGGKVFVQRFGTTGGKDAGYWRDIGTIDAYWQANMDLASVNPVFNLYDKQWPIRTYHGNIRRPRRFCRLGYRQGGKGFGFHYLRWRYYQRRQSCQIGPFS
jgi:glucose-1-phosphate adenylyltransferase